MKLELFGLRDAFFRLFLGAKYLAQVVLGEVRVLWT